jgi:hypothetical protein
MNGQTAAFLHAWPGFDRTDKENFFPFLTNCLEFVLIHYYNTNLKLLRLSRREYYNGGKKRRKEEKGCQAREIHHKKDGQKSREELRCKEKHGQKEDALESRPKGRAQESEKDPEACFLRDDRTARPTDIPG